MIQYIQVVASYGRKDRLFPGDPRLLRTNPLSIAYGACGIAFVLNRIQGYVPQEMINWILARRKTHQTYAPGLYVGLAGIAWAMFEIGLHEDAEKVLRAAYTHPLLYASPDLFYGVAGWGLASLAFFSQTQDEFYLDKAKEAGNHLISVHKRDEKGVYWVSDEGTPLGYAFGASGISLFLLYLYAVTRTSDFIDLGRAALEFDINNGQPTDDGGITWKRIADKGRIVYPYWMYGSAGIGSVVLRYYTFVREERYKLLLFKIYRDAFRKYSIFPSLFLGLAGKGEFLLDLYRFIGDPEFLDAAYRAATGISLYKIPRAEGLAFPGEGLRRISCDYGTGSAGIAHFFHRLTHPTMSTAFNLDKLL